MISESDIIDEYMEAAADLHCQNEVLLKEIEKYRALADSARVLCAGDFGRNGWNDVLDAAARKIRSILKEV